MIEPEAVADWLAAEERTQAWLGRKVGVSGAHINGWLSGKHDVSVGVLRKIGAVTGLDQNELASAVSDGGAG